MSMLMLMIDADIAPCTVATAGSVDENTDVLEFSRATPETVDFSKSEVTRSRINTWVENQTNNKIKDLIAAGALTSQTKLVLVNAIYFKV